MSLRHLLLAGALVFSSVGIARADIVVDLATDAAAAAAQSAKAHAKKTPKKVKPHAAAPNSAAPKNTAGKQTRNPVNHTGLSLMDRPVPIGIARRGPVPVLPPVDGSAELPAQAAPSQTTVQARLGKITADGVNVFRLPDPQSMWVSRLPKGQAVAIVSQWQGWYAIIMSDGSQAYVPGATVEVLPFQVKSVTPGKSPAPAPTPMATPAAHPMGMMSTRFAPQVKAAVQDAMHYVGTPYVYGGNSETGIDCSGLVRNCFLAQGINLPRRASEQAQIGDNVPLDRLEVGDRLYFSVKKEYDHTGLYLGNGYFVHASMSRGQVAVDHLSTPLYGNHLAAARRF